MATDKKNKNNETIVKDLEQKLKTMFQAIQRLQKIVKAVEMKANRGVDISRRNAMEITKIKSLLKQRE